jgi:biopolymer transport protein ExbB/TolQ
MGAISKAFEEGGLFMWPILLWGILALAIIFERVYYLYRKANENKEVFIKRVEGFILKGDLNKLIKFTALYNSPLARIINAGLQKVKGTDEDVQAATDEASLREMPMIEKRTSYLAMLGNIAMLSGLLGTIVGVIRCFAAVAQAEASERASELSKGISEALNCTAFGLIVAITALIFYALLQGKTQAIIDDVNEGTVRVLNFIIANKDKLKSDKEERTEEKA